MQEHDAKRLISALPMSRREWLRGASMLGLGLSATSMLPRMVGTAFAQEQPRSGGTLACWASGDPPNFDPFSNTSSFALNVIGPCYNSLVMMDPLDPDKIKGDLAESWEVSPDGKALTFRLLKDVKFHDGKPFTSADVKHTFDLCRDPPPSITSVRKSLLSAISQIVAVDDHTVRFELSRPSPALLASLATGWFVVLPKHVLEAKGDMKRDVVGTGPFRFKDYARGVSIELVKNPNYHVKGRPYLDGIKYFVVPDPGTAYAYMRTGQLHLYDGVSGNDARRAEQEFGDKVVVHRSSSYIGDPFTINATRKPFDDIRVRKALAMSIDREEALKVVIDGDAVIAGFMPQGLWGIPQAELEKIPGYGKDIAANRAEAKRLLAEAGYPEGFATTLTVRKAAGTHEPRAIFLSDQFARIGIKTKLDIQESATYFETMRQRKFDMATNVISALANDPDFLLGDFHTSNGTLNYSGLSNPQLDNLYLKQSQTVDPVERKKLAQQFEVMALNEFGTVNLYFKKKSVMTSRRVRNYVIHPEPDNNRRMQEIWLVA